MSEIIYSTSFKRVQFEYSLDNIIDPKLLVITENNRIITEYPLSITIENNPELNIDYFYSLAYFITENFDSLKDKESPYFSLTKDIKDANTSPLIMFKLTGAIITFIKYLEKTGKFKPQDVDFLTSAPTTFEESKKRYYKEKLLVESCSEEFNITPLMNIIRKNQPIKLSSINQKSERFKTALEIFEFTKQLDFNSLSGSTILIIDIFKSSFATGSTIASMLKRFYNVREVVFITAGQRL